MVPVMGETIAGGITVSPAGEGRRLQVIADLVELRVSTQETDNALLACELVVPPGAGPPLNRHNQTEVLRIIEGDFVIVDEDGLEIPLKAGDAALIPSGAWHRYRNTGHGMGRMWCVITPGGMEGFFEELGVLSDATEPAPVTERPDVDRILTVAAHHGIEVRPDGSSPPDDGGPPGRR